MNKNQKVSAKNLTKKENIDEQSLVAGALIGSSVPSVDTLTAQQNQLQAKSKSKKAVDAELITVDQEESAVNQKIDDIEQTEVVMVDATVVELELTSDVKKDCKINSKGVEECDDGIGWWWLAGLPLLALGGGGGGGAAAPAPASASSDTYRHNDFAHFSEDIDELLIDNVTDSTVEVFLVGGEHVELQNIEDVEDFLAALLVAQDAAAAAQTAADEANAALADAPDDSPLMEDAVEAADALALALEALDDAESDLLDSEALADLVYALGLYPAGDWADIFDEELGEAYSDLTAAIRAQNADAVQAALNDLLPQLDIVTNEYNQAIYFDEDSAGIREFKLFVEDADNVVMSINYSEADSLEKVAVHVSQQSTLTVSGSGGDSSLVALGMFSGGNNDNAEVNIDVIEGSQLSVLAGDGPLEAVNLVALLGDGALVNLKTNDSYLQFSGGVFGSGEDSSIGIFVGGNDAEINVDLLNESDADITLEGYASNFVYVAGNDATVNLTLDDDATADFYLDGEDREFVNGDYNTNLIEAGGSIVAIEGDDATIELNVRDNSSLEVYSALESGGDNRSSVIAVEGDDADITLTSWNNSGGGLLVRDAGDVVNVIGHGANIQLIVGNNSPEEEGYYSGASFIETRGANRSDILRVVGDDAFVDVDMFRNSRIGVFGNGGDIININGDDSIVDLDIQALAINGAYSNIELGNSVGGSIDSFSGGVNFGDQKNLIDIDGDDALVNFDALIEVGNLDIEINDGNIIDVKGERAEININLTAQFDENIQQISVDGMDINLEANGGGDIVNVSGNNAVLRLNAISNVDDGSDTGALIDILFRGENSNLVDINGNDSLVDLYFAGGVDVKGYELAKIHGDNAEIRINAIDSGVFGESDQNLDLEVSGGISVFGDNASVTFNATGVFNQNIIEWDDQESLISIFNVNPLLDDLDADIDVTDSEIIVNIDNAFLSGGYIASLNGENADINVKLSDVVAYTGGVSVNGNSSNIEYELTSSYLELDMAHWDSSGGAFDTGTQLLNLTGDDNTFRFELNDVTATVEENVNIFAVNGSNNTGFITVNESLDFDADNSGGAEYDEAKFLSVFGENNITNITLNSSDLDFDESSFIEIDGDLNSTTLRVNESQINFSSGGFSGGFSELASQLFNINGDDNSLTIELESQVRANRAYIDAESDFSEVNGNGNTVNVNFMQNSYGDLGIEVAGDENILNLDFNRRDVGGSAATVTLDLTETLDTEINISGTQSRFGIGSAEGGHSIDVLDHNGSFIDGDETIINIDLTNNSSMAFDATFASGGDARTSTVNVDSDNSIFGLDFDINDDHRVIINLNNIDQNILRLNGDNARSYLELYTDSSGRVQINNGSSVDAISTFIYGQGSVDLAETNRHYVGNYDNVYVDLSRHLEIDDFEFLYDKINLSSNTTGADWFDMDAFTHEQVQDWLELNVENGGAAVLYTASENTSFDMDFDADTGGNQVNSAHLESIYGDKIYLMNYYGDDLVIYRWLDLDVPQGEVNDPTQWVHMVTLHNIGVDPTIWPATANNDHIDDNFSRFVGFTTFNQNFDNWSVYGV